MYSEAVEFLDKQGLRQYEISNFARKGAESRHNLKYWRREAYLGLGLDAHSMLRTKAGAAMRFATTDELDPFLEAAGGDEPRTLAREEDWKRRGSWVCDQTQALALQLCVWNLGLCRCMNWSRC